MIYFLIRYLFLFILGSILGWCLEVVYRRFFGQAKKWINPGFLSGPFLPIYGTGISILYIISDLNIALSLRLILFIVITTALEYMTGLFFLKYYKTRLWDYTGLRFNIQGIIAPLYSLFWGVLALAFYYVLYPLFNNEISYMYMHLEYSLLIGILLGIMVVDLNNSFNIIVKLKKFAETVEDFSFIINYEQLKIEIREQFDNFSSKFERLEESIGEGKEFRLNAKLKKLLIRKQRPTFLLPFRSDSQLTYRLQELLKHTKARKKK